MTSAGCIICCEAYNPSSKVLSVIKCGHTFHVNCFETWMNTSRTCPSCRCEISGAPRSSLIQTINFQFAPGVTKDEAELATLEKRLKFLKEKVKQQRLALENDFKKARLIIVKEKSNSNPNQSRSLVSKAARKF